ncbi:MAG: dockerin type I repeat-containing protein, partial [Prevotella sp.]|nr:dockerin type I repeat-containing protein [Prevotella sp.]
HEGILGDVNGDELVNISDVVLLVEYILNVDNPSFIKDNADINRDNTINISDVTQLVNIILESD